MLEHASNAGIEWTLTTQTVFDEDSGKESLRVTHTYGGPLKAGSEIRFEMIFRTLSDPFTDRAVMESDSGVCKMKIDTQDTRFWITTAEDGSYDCTNTICGTYDNTKTPGVYTASYKGPANFKQDTKNDWTVPLKDNDITKPMCVPYTAAELGEDPYRLLFACKQISCTIQRPLVTGDAQDFQFYNPGKGLEDELQLAIQRSNMSINFLTATPYVVYGASKPSPNKLATIIPVSSGALSGLSSIFATAIAGYLLF